MSKIVPPETHGAKRTTHAEGCGICEGKVVTCPDPDENKDCGPVKDMTYCVGCGEIYSPWTMPYFERVKASREKSK